MVAMLAAWIFLAATSIPIGLLILGSVGARQFPSLVFWTALLAEALLLQALALAGPLYPAGLAAVALVAVIATIGNWSALGGWLRIEPRREARGLTAFAAAIPLAVVATAPVSYYDSGLYHIPFLHWLARDGIVPGLGLLHIRLGIPSDWFALAALFDGGPLTARMAAACNAYVVLLLLVQAGTALARLYRRRASRADWVFTAAAAVLILESCWVDSTVSASPDLPVGAITLLIGWAMMRHDGAERAPVTARLYLVLLFLAAMAVALKLSAAPVLAVTGLFSLWRLGLAPRMLASSAVVVLCALLPSVSASIVLSGCPVFPAHLACLDLPWTVPAAAAEDFRAGITRFARWYASPPLSDSAFGWIGPYLFHPGNRVNPPLLALAAASLLVIFARGRRRLARGVEGWVLALAVTDLSFVLVTAPDTRFAIGAIALLVGLAVSTIPPLRRVPRAAEDGESPAAGTAPAFALLCGLAIIALRVTVVDAVIARRWAAQPYGPVLVASLDVPLSQRWLLPPPLPVIYGETRRRDGEIYRLDTRKSGSLTYAAPPIGDQCWGSDLLCTPGPAAPLRLRQPARGPAGGFIRSD